jgi:hypothetical protein
LPPALSRRIADGLGREFAAQAIAERAAGLPVSVMLAHDDSAMGKLEVGFIGALAPTFFLPRTERRLCAERILRM